MNLNFSPPPFDPMEQINDDEHDQQHHHHLNFGLNHQIVSSSSSSASCHIFFNSTRDHAGFYHPQLYQPHHHPEDDYYNACHGRSFDQNKVENGVKLSLWKKGDEAQISCDDRVKWMASSKTKKNPTAQSISAAKNIEVKKVKPSSSVETDDLSSNSSSYNCNAPIRVCSDCHTTKTPLWRSGPKGPKSLCNACGIRQRKARRAMAAAAAAANGGGVACDPPRAVKVKVKVKVKEKMGLKKRCKVASGGSSAKSGKKINGLEDFLINLSNKLAFHRMFPQDEKEAAILLMALSSGRVHG